MDAPVVMKKSSLRNHERALKWEKVKVEKAMNDVILEKAIPLAEKLIEIALEGNPNAINSLLDRAFGKARQNIGLDGGATDKPIVFMPAALMAKYAIKAGTYTELDSPTDGEPVAVIREPIPDENHEG